MACSVNDTFSEEQMQCQNCDFLQIETNRTVTVLKIQLYFVRNRAVPVVSTSCNELYYLQDYTTTYKIFFARQLNIYYFINIRNCHTVYNC